MYDYIKIKILLFYEKFHKPSINARYNLKIYFCNVYTRHMIYIHDIWRTPFSKEKDKPVEIHVKWFWIEIPQSTSQIWAALQHQH